MTKKKSLLPVAVSAAFAATAVLSPVSHAADNPFGAQKLSSGYLLADAHGKTKEGACGGKGKEGSCGGDKKKEGACGEKKKEGSCGNKSVEKKKDGKCGEGKCGAAKKAEGAK